MRREVKRGAWAALRIRSVGALTRRVAAMRGRSLALIYHRLAEEETGLSVVPTIPPGLFRRQMEALTSIGHVVPLPELLDEGERGNLRFALTFDDDYPSHLGLALPVLQELDLPATFFLSGRVLHGSGPYWFEALERWIRERGLKGVAGHLDVAPDLEAVVRACETDERLRRLAEREGANGASHLDEGDIRALADAGMTIGFHTLDHPVLTRLSDADLSAAVRMGRRELADVVGRPLDLFAYPHGKADVRTARAVREAGYSAAWTGTPGPMRPGEDRYRLGRWEPGPLEIDDFLVSLTVRLSRPVPVR